MIMEYALLNKEETTLSLQRFWWQELSCSYCSVIVDACYIPVWRSFHYFASINCQEILALYYFLPPQ